ncbi:MAG: response regulator [Myxococcales bacterium]|nr:response regulator [Myxococcales bacterium]
MMEAEVAVDSTALNRGSRARAEFVSSLGRRLTALRHTLHQLEDEPSSWERRNMLLRRVHALGSAARVLGFEGVGQALGDAELALSRGEAGDAVTSTELAEVSRALDVLPSIAWGAKPPQSTLELPDDVGVLSSGWPLSIVVFGPAALQSSLSAGDDQMIEVELATDAEGFRELAERVGPDVAVVDGDVRGARELIENLAHDPDLPPFPVIVVGSFENPEAASSFVSLGAARVLPKPVGPDVLWNAVREVCQHETGLRGPREPIGDVTVDDLAQRIAAEVRRGLVEGVDPASASVSVPLGDGTDVLAAVWGAVARVRELLTMRSRGSVRFTAGGPEGAVPLAPWTSADRRAGERGVLARRTDGVRLEGRRAVVVDDDPAVVWFLSGLLRTSGVEVAEAHDGLRARELVFENMPDLVVSDVLMPGLDGFSLCRAIKRDVAVRDVPVILLSWKEDLLQRLRELGAEADGYLRKEAAASTVLLRFREVLRPRARVESRLASGGEVRGRLDGMTTRLLLELARRNQPNSRIMVRDSVYLYELEMREGRPSCITRTATDGSFDRGARALDALIGVTAGRFVVTPSTSPTRDDLSGTLDELIAPRVKRARALQQIFDARELDHIDSLLLDGETVGAYLDATPEPARRLFAQLLGGSSPRALLEQAPEQRYFLEQVLADVARRGAVIDVTRDGELVDFDRSLSPPAALVAPLDASPAPLFTLDLSPAPPEVADAVHRWEAAPDEMREASFPLPLSRAVTPIPAAPQPDSRPTFADEPHTAPGIGPMPVVMTPAGSAASEPEPSAVSATSAVESRSASTPGDEGAQAMHAPEPAVETARSEDPTASPAEARATEGSASDQDDDDSSEAPLLSPRPADATPATLRAEPASDAPDEDEASLEAEPVPLSRPSKRVPAVTLPSARPIEFPPRASKRSLDEVSAKSVSSRAPAPAKALTEDKPMAPAKIVLIVLGAAIAAFGAVTVVRSQLKPAPVGETAAVATETALPAVSKPAAPPAVKLAVEDLGIGPGTAVTSDKGLIEVDIGEKHPIYIDGTFVGRGPLRKAPVMPGAHEVVIKAPTGELSVQVDVKVGRRSRVTLPPPAP